MNKKLVSALRASQSPLRGAAPLRRLLSAHGVLCSVLAKRSSSDQEISDLESSLLSIPGPCIAQLLSSLLEEVKNSRNVESILVFVARLISLRYNKGKPSSGRERLFRIPGPDAWVAVLSFIIAHESLIPRFNRHCLGRGQHSNDKRNSQDRVVELSLDIVNSVRLMHVGDGIENIESDTSALIERCFPGSLKEVDVVVSRLEAEKEAPGDTALRGDAGALSQRCSVDTFGWWDGIDLESIHCSDDEDWVENGVPCSAVEEGVEEKDSRAWENATDTAMMKSDESVRLDRVCLTLRTELVDLAPGATSSDVHSYASRIADLVREVGADLGADGVKKVGTLLAYGVPTDEVAEVPGGASMPLSDVLISDLVNIPGVCDAGTSAVRANAFIYSFVLPLFLLVGRSPRSGTSRNKTASRILATTVMALTRERPSEIVESLFLPALCLPGAPGKAQCELVSRVIKSVPLSSKTTSQFVDGLIRGSPRAVGPMIWTEVSMPILSNILSKREALDSRHIEALVDRIDDLSLVMSKNMKFSTLFHTFICRYGAEIKESGRVNILEQAAARLETFMGKSIKSTLKRIAT